MLKNSIHTLCISTYAQNNKPDEYLNSIGRQSCEIDTLVTQNDFFLKNYVTSEGAVSQTALHFLC